jgi:flagellar assembly protein FliH
MSCKILSPAVALQPIAWPVACDEAAGAGMVRQASLASGLQSASPEASALLAARLQQAREDGYRQGFAEGEQRSAQQSAALSARMARSIEETAGCRMRLRREAEQGIVDLALAVARRILHREISIDPEALLGVIRSAADRISAREITEVRLHPAQVGMVRQFIDSLDSPVPIRISGDPALEPGAVWFETVRGVLDASLDTQIEEIRRGFADRLGRDH